MQFTVLTLYPAYFEQALQEGVVGRALRECKTAVHTVQLRSFAKDKHHTVDGAPFGGGPGMVMRPDVLFRAWQATVEALTTAQPELRIVTILLSPAGIPLRQQTIEGLVLAPAYDHILLICGRFEGVDERFIEECVDLELSLGDFVLSGGEPAALVFLDACIRLLPGVLGNEDSLRSESFSAARNRGLEHAQYTQPREFAGREVPEVLLSGNHAAIARWRAQDSEKRTRERRPDLLSQASYVAAATLPASERGER